MKLALVWLVFDGGVVRMVTAGAVRSTSQLRLAAALWFPAGSTAITAKAWTPAARDE